MKNKLGYAIAALLFAGLPSQLVLADLTVRVPAVTTTPGATVLVSVQSLINGTNKPVSFDSFTETISGGLTTAAATGSHQTHSALNQNSPVVNSFFTVTVPEGTPAGTYHGTVDLRFSATDGDSGDLRDLADTVPFEVRVITPEPSLMLISAIGAGALMLVLARKRRAAGL